MSNEVLYKGIFWIVDAQNLSNNKDYCFKIASDVAGNAIGEFVCNYASQNGATYNHKVVWQQLGGRLTHNKPYNFYPRGRVEIHRGTAKIFLNGNINNAEVAKFIKQKFNLSANLGVSKVIVIEDNSRHYLCNLDKGYLPAK